MPLLALVAVAAAQAAVACTTAGVPAAATRVAVHIETAMKLLSQTSPHFYFRLAAPLKSGDEEVTAEPACRNRFLQPFASTSIWNTAIGSAAQFVHAHLFDASSNVTCVRQPCGPPFSFHNDQDFIIHATEADPVHPPLPMCRRL